MFQTLSFGFTVSQAKLPIIYNYKKIAIQTIYRLSCHFIYFGSNLFVLMGNVRNSVKAKESMRMVIQTVQQFCLWICLGYFSDHGLCAG